MSQPGKWVPGWSFLAAAYLRNPLVLVVNSLTYSKLFAQGVRTATGDVCCEAESIEPADMEALFTIGRNTIALRRSTAAS